MKIKVICLLKDDKYAKYMETYLAEKIVTFGTELWMVYGFSEDTSGGRRAFNIKDFITIGELRDQKIDEILD